MIYIYIYRKSEVGPSAVAWHMTLDLEKNMSIGNYNPKHYTVGTYSLHDGI